MRKKNKKEWRRTPPTPVISRRNVKRPGSVVRKRLHRYLKSHRRIIRRRWKLRDMLRKGRTPWLLISTRSLRGTQHYGRRKRRKP